MRVFVAGATGFIGRATCRALVAAGHEVAGLARSPEGARDLAGDGVRAVAGTLDDPASYHAEAGRPEAVIHLAATWFPGSETVEEARSIGQRILEWTRGLARLALDSGSRIFVFTGSNVGRAAPERGGAGARRQGGAGGGSREARGYDRLLELSQSWLEKQAREVPLAVVLPGWVYGARSWFPDLVREIREGRTTHVIDGGSAVPGYVHVDDVGEAFRLAAERGAPGAFYNVVDEDPVSAREFVERTASALGSPVPRGVSRDEAVRERGEVYAEALTCSVDPDVGRARRDLGWRPRYPSSRDGLPPALRSLGV